MEPFSFVLVGLFVFSIFFAVFIYFLFFHSKKHSDASSIPVESILSLLNDLRRELQENQGSARVEMTDRMDRMHNQLLSNLTESSATLQKHFKHTSGIVQDVTTKLTKLDETNRQVLGFSEQLQSLENILRNPKQRGILGEYWLETLLGQVLQPTQYKMQYELGVDSQSGQKLIPDAVIFVKDLIIPIDAKFSLENYNRIQEAIDAKQRDQLERDFKNDVKMRIDETSKYVLPEFGTTNFAFMFVPAEGVYHNLVASNVGAVSINTRNLIEYAFEKRVMLVSPTSFYAYLQTVLHGLKALQIEESVKEIQKHAENLMTHMRAYEQHHNKLGKHLETTYRAYSDSTNELRKVDKDVFKITGGTAGKEIDLVDIQRPLIEE